MQSSKNLHIDIPSLDIRKNLNLSEDNHIVEQEKPDSPLSPIRQSLILLEKEIKDLQEINKKQKKEITVLKTNLQEEEKTLQSYLSLQEKEKIVRDKLNNCLKDEIRMRTKSDERINQFEQQNKSLRTEIDQLKTKLASPQDKMTADAKEEAIKQMSRADEMTKDYKKLTALYEQALKELSEKKKEMQRVQQENLQLKNHINASNKPRYEKSPIKTASGFFPEKKSYNKDEKTTFDIDKIFEI